MKKEKKYRALKSFKVLGEQIAKGDILSGVKFSENLIKKLISKGVIESEKV